MRNADASNLISGRYLYRVIGLREVVWAEPVLIGNGLFRTPAGLFDSVRVVGVRRLELTRDDLRGKRELATQKVIPNLNSTATSCKRATKNNKSRPPELNLHLNRLSQRNLHCAHR